jgi:hypothetical protein
MKKSKKKIPFIVKLLAVLLLAFILFLAWIKIRGLDSKQPLPLAIRWEGLYLQKNFRDVGESINSCLGKELIKPDLILRANGWFSGWDCDTVGNPETIYSLNHDPDQAELYYCWNQRTKHPNIGRFYNPEIKLDDLEFPETWKNEVMSTAACRFFDEIFTSIIASKRILIHCNAGRDRTGTYSALLSALAFEAADKLDALALDAIECDYRKTESLIQEKYGRMRNLIRQLQDKGGIKQFFQQQCKIPPDKIEQVAQQLLL